MIFQIHDVGSVDFNNDSETGVSSFFEVKDLKKSFGGLVAVDNVSFEIERGTITGLIGPNGAGKTTLLNLISGFYDLDTGDIVFKGDQIGTLQPYERAQRGLVRTFQNTRELTGLTVIDNMLLAYADDTGEMIRHLIVNRNAVKTVEQSRLQEAKKWLKLLDLWEHRNDYAGNLSVGQQKLLELGRALVNNPDFLLLDEPVAGVNPTLTNKILDAILDQKDNDVTFLIIEHDIESLMSISDRVIAMHEGQILTSGSPSEVQENERLLDAYLGVQL